jgi:alpha-beta hydrolase superfamily lysophospholipase
MKTSDFQHTASDGKKLFVRRFLPEGTVKAVVHISHGMAEHSARYARVAEPLTAAGIAVYVNDHRGHGKTIANEDEKGFFEGGAPRVLLDLVELMTWEKAQHPSLPFGLFGHSMGSFLVQELMITHGSHLQAAVLSGSNGRPSLLAAAGRYVARLERIRVGVKGHSSVLRGLAFDAFNKPFGTRSKFEWLSRDTAEVDKYVADPLCGFEVSTDLWVAVLDLLGEIARPERQALIPKALPIYVFAGGDDMSSERAKGVRLLVSAYLAAGLKDVTHHIYEGARHETLNETNRAEVEKDLVGWLASKLVR